MRYFTADWHFGHSNIIKYCDRPHRNVENMNDHFVKAISKRVDPTDELWCLGDLSIEVDTLRALLARIPCTVHWIKGNHDVDPEAISDLAEFHGQRVELHLDRDKRDGHPMKLVLDHYPMRSWNASYHGSIQLHGHVHGNIDNSGIRRSDVGVDTEEWKMAYGGISQKKIVDAFMKIPAPKHRD